MDSKLMIWILILILNHPILVKPPLLPIFIYPKSFASEIECNEAAKNQANKNSVMTAYCQEIKPVMVK